MYWWLQNLMEWILYSLVTIIPQWLRCAVWTTSALNWMGFDLMQSSPSLSILSYSILAWPIGTYNFNKLLMSVYNLHKPCYTPVTTETEKTKAVILVPTIIPYPMDDTVTLLYLLHHINHLAESISITEGEQKLLVQFSLFWKP